MPEGYLVVIEKKRLIFGLSALYVPLFLIQVPSLLFFGFGAYTNELDLYGQSYAPLGFSLVVILFLSALGLGVALATKGTVSGWVSNPKQRLTESVIYVFLLVYAIPIFIYGPAFLIGMDRYEYSSLPISAYTNSLKSYFPFILFLNSLVLLPTKRTKVIWIYLLIAFVMVLRGEKFSGLFLLLLSYFAASVTVLGFRIRLFMKVFGLILAILIVIVLTYAYGSYSLDLNGAVFAVQSRVVKQGQLLFYFFEVHDHISFKFSYLIEALNYWGERLSGMKGMMSIAMPEEFYLEKEGSLTGGYPAALLLSGIKNPLTIALITQIMLLPLYKSVVSYLNLLANAKGFLLIISIVVLTYQLTVYSKIFGSGDLYLLSSPYFLFTVLYFFVMRTFMSARSIKKDLHDCG